MKTLLTFFVLFFSSSVLADDISDFQIEGMSVGDSLLDYYPKQKIIDSIEVDDGYNDDEFYYVQIEDNKFNIYEVTQVHLKNKDNKYIIYAIAGGIYFDNEMSNCINKKNKIVNDISRTLSSAKKTDYGTYEHPVDQTGQTIVTSVYFDFGEDFGKGLDHIAIGCTDWSKKFEQTGLVDNLRVNISTKEFDYWINNIAY